MTITAVLHTQKYFPSKHKVYTKLRELASKFLIHILKLSVLKLKEESRIFTAKTFPSCQMYSSVANLVQLKNFFLYFR